MISQISYFKMQESNYANRLRMKMNCELYARLNNKPDEILKRYKRILMPEGLIDSIAALLDHDRQLKIHYIDDILEFRRGEFEKNKSADEIRTIAEPYSGVNCMMSDYDAKNVREKYVKPRTSILSKFLSRGYR